MNEFEQAELSVIRFTHACRDARRTSRRHTVKRLLTRRRMAWAAFFAVCWGLTPLAFAWADAQRGYDSTGGEALIPLIPVIALVLTVANRKSMR